MADTSASPPPGAAAGDENNNKKKKERSRSGSRDRGRGRGRERRRGSSPEADDIGKVTVLDVLRVLGGVVLLNFALSWYITGESFLWGWRPWFSRPDGLRAWLRGPVLLTDEQLAAYDGSDPSKPIYLGLNGTIYDVTPGRHFYGPNGGYHFFAGRDAARAFVTGCFDTDLTPDLRGAEDMYIPTDVPEEAESELSLSPADRDARDARERAEARRKVDDVVAGWAHVFAGGTGKEYLAVGRIVREEGWLERLPRRELCEKAAGLRPKGRVKKRKSKGKGKGEGGEDAAAAKEGGKR
ncbi:cytochrome b5-like heme steroid binding domain-containing protein [Diplodia corticola]|uniref:Cytochrome b5-like heme steroid binding domain-containing protein n=1 Tax=Diplodia corticola TaxID=236234 RepID=A0A1J9QP02_9PEZI|nr:cytochrome b5-like heme steroid binding domain-containing protein [Diplodia corticola]OJD30176.1 cytochrome b5-like heme steroid binding domain-containing protein [Diplodia corticola]